MILSEYGSVVIPGPKVDLWPDLKSQSTEILAGIQISKATTALAFYI